MTEQQRLVYLTAAISAVSAAGSSPRVVRRMLERAEVFALPVSGMEIPEAIEEIIKAAEAVGLLPKE